MKPDRWEYFAKIASAHDDLLREEDHPWLHLGLFVTCLMLAFVMDEGLVKSLFLVASGWNLYEALKHWVKKLNSWIRSKR